MFDYVFTLFHRVCFFFFFQAEDGIRDLVRSRGLGDVYKRQRRMRACGLKSCIIDGPTSQRACDFLDVLFGIVGVCLLYTSDAADERSSVDLGGRRIIQKKKKRYTQRR